MPSAKKTPLHERHEKLGAIFGETGGFLLPESYGYPEKEAESARKSVSVADISARTKLVLSGKDHLRFLQGILTNDISGKTPGEGAYAAVLTPKGKMVSDMRVSRCEDSVRIDAEPGMGGALSDLLLRFRLSYKAEVRDVTEDFCLLHACGPGSAQFVAQRLGADAERMKEHDHLACGGAFVAKADRTGETGFDILCANRDAADIWDILQGPPAAALSGRQALEILRIEAGIPVYGKDMDLSTIPIEAGIWNALDFEKGCYVGQEVIARIKWRGRVNWHLAYFEARGGGGAAAGDHVWAGGKKVGRITSSAYSPHMGKNIAIGYIRREFRGFREDLAVGGESPGDEAARTVGLSEKPFCGRFERTGKT